MIYELKFNDKNKKTRKITMNSKLTRFANSLLHLTTCKICAQKFLLALLQILMP